MEVSQFIIDKTMKKILVVFGTRPEAIKLAPIIDILKTMKGKFSVIVCITGQHRDMLDQTLSLFNISADFNLNIMKSNQDLFDITISSLKGLKKILAEVKPDIIIVQGDTTTAFSAGLAAYYMQIPVAHIEAGLRTYDKYSPYPEEINRHLLSVIVDYHFASTEWGKLNLKKEGIPEERIWVTGNTVIDALLKVVEELRKKEVQRRFIESFKNKWGISLTTSDQRIILVTGHRRENFGQALKEICKALRMIALRFPEAIIVYPVHLNPHVKAPVNKALNGVKNIFLLEPLSYEEFVLLMDKSYLILTDSGGIQEEAPSLGKPVLVMRKTTERPEGIAAGVSRLTGTTSDSILKNVVELFEDNEVYKKMARATNPYGDGKASERIVDILSSLLN